MVGQQVVDSGAIVPLGVREEHMLFRRDGDPKVRRPAALLGEDALPATPSATGETERLPKIERHAAGEGGVL
jgi:hypothetical protein